MAALEVSKTLVCSILRCSQSSQESPNDPALPKAGVRSWKTSCGFKSGLVSQSGMRASTIRHLQPRLSNSDTCRTRNPRASESGSKFRLRVMAAGFGGAGKEKAAGGKGFGTKTGGKQEPDPASLLRKSMKHYDKIVDAGVGYVEYVVSVRRRGEGRWGWLPVAHFLVTTEELSTEIIQAGLTICSRELRECRDRSICTKGESMKDLEYAYEPMDSFLKRDLVTDFYEREAGTVGGEKKKQKPVQECAYGVLGLPKGALAAQVRTAYRSLAAAHHPDRHVGGDQEKAEVEFKRIGDAYERIKSSGGDANNALLGGATEADSNMSAPFQLPKTTEYESHSLPPDISFAVYPIVDELASLSYGVYMRKKRQTVAAVSK